MLEAVEVQVRQPEKQDWQIVPPVGLPMKPDAQEEQLVRLFEPSVHTLQATLQD